MLVFDTLYGLGRQVRSRSRRWSPAHVVEDDGKQWDLTLRDGLKFHDGTPVLARDCVASIQRWGTARRVRQALMAATDELSAPSDDKTIRLPPEEAVPAAAGRARQTDQHVRCIMPERLAQTDPFKQVHGDGRQRPVRFIADERVSGLARRL